MSPSSSFLGMQIYNNKNLLLQSSLKRPKVIFPSIQVFQENVKKKKTFFFTVFKILEYNCRYIVGSGNCY